MDRMPLGLDELVEHWTVLDDERKLIAGKGGPTRLGFTLLLKYQKSTGAAMSDIRSTRAALPDLADGTTHVLHFGHYCGGSRLDRLRGLGLWLLITADEYNMGYADSESDDRAMDAPEHTPVQVLADWVSARVGYQVALTRSDEVIGGPDRRARVGAPRPAASP